MNEPSWKTGGENHMNTVRKSILTLLLGALLLAGAPAWAATEFVYDVEPNDQIQQAVLLRAPAHKEIVRIIGELKGQDQDAYYLAIDEEAAGVRWNLRLEGRAGAVTKLDIFDLTEAMDGGGHARLASLELSKRPPILATLGTRDGSRPALLEDLLLEPGNYVLGVSHSGGEGSYEVQISRAGAESLRPVPDANGPDSPLELRKGRLSAVLSQEQTVYAFSIDEEEASQQWALMAHAPLGVTADVALLDAAGATLLNISGSGGVPLRRSGLQLAAGDYRIVARTRKLAAQRILVAPGGLAAEGREVEPNDSAQLAVETAPGQALSGSLSATDRADWFRFTIDEEQAGTVWEISATPADAGLGKLRLCLRPPAQPNQQCVDGKGQGGVPVTLHNLGLTPGEYLLYLDARSGAGDWNLSWRAVGKLTPGQEVEPNDRKEWAVAWPDGKPAATGRFDGWQETDFWRFTVSGEPQLWRVQLQGENLFELALHDSRGSIASARASGSKRVRLDSLFLTPGDYFLAASGSDSDYRLLLRPQGPPDPNAELEPNDSFQNALPLAFGQERHGLLAEKSDKDIYQFSLAGPEHVRVRVRPPADGAVGGTLAVGDDMQGISAIHGARGEVLDWDVYLPAGDYSITLTPRTVSDAEYHISLERLPLFDGRVDRDPNDYPEQASVVPAHGRIAGEVGHNRRASDWFRLPPVEASTEISIEAVAGLGFALHERQDTKADRLSHDRNTGRYTATLEPGREYLLGIKGKGAYAFDLFGSQGDEPTVLPVEIDIVFDESPRLQAYSPWEQVLHGRLALRNSAGTEQRVDVQTVLSDDRGRLELASGGWALAPGAAMERPFVLVAPTDARGDYPLRVNVRAFDASGAEVGTFVDVDVQADALPANPRHAWTIAPELRGGFNLAGKALGATAVESPGIDLKRLGQLDAIIDGLAEYGRWKGMILHVGTGTRPPEDYPQPTFELAGDAPVPVKGFLLNPTGTFHEIYRLREFAVALSLDGEHFETVVRGQLSPASIEQAFLLDTPVPARYARLMPLSHHGAGDKLSLGEFKVVAEPGFVPKHLERRNLAAPELGGHLVWADPWIRQSGFDKALLIKDDKGHTLKLSDDPAATVVLGFHHSRAARIAAMSFDKLTKVSAGTDVKRVAIARSDSSPLGPFEPVGEWDLDAGESTIELEQPVWARYLRFRFHGEDGAKALTLPDRIAVWEAAVDDDYRSILGEWGHYSSNGPWEAGNEPRYPGLPQRPDNDSRETALPVAAGETAGGLALLDTYESWYRFDVPAGENTLALSLRGDPTLQARPELLDAAGEPVPLYADEADPRRMHWRAWVEPGQPYWLRVFEPPRALMFSWDTSASVGWYLPSLANALYRYAGQIRPGRDVVNLLPFGYGKPLLQDWQGEPYPLKRLLGSFPHDSNSSAAESALAVASRELAKRPPGKRGVILLTDAATSMDARLWPALREAHPMVFALAVSSEGAFGRHPPEEQDLMQEWSRVNGGDYQYVTGLGSLHQGFERAIARMRQPVGFEVAVAYSFTENPGPAQLRLVSSEKGLDPGARGAVEIILDASGSMLKRMDGERRIQIAKRAIADVIDNAMPDGMPLALRVYGHREAGSCRSDLEQPLAPLDKAALRRKLDGINAVNLARTPIADSLAQVAKDLAAAKGRRLVILLTDGEETCDGDPAAVLEKLAADGVDLRLNIVGFAIDDDALKAEFTRWAELGGGLYFDAAEAEALQEAMARALQIPYTVKDTNGETVASGVLDGEAVELPAGRYLVELQTQPPRRFRDVSLAPGESRELDIGAQ